MPLLVGPAMRQTPSFGRALGIELGQRPVPGLDDVLLVIKGPVAWRRPGEQTLTAKLSNPEADVLYCHQAARTETKEERRQAAEREAGRPVCRWCGRKATDQRREKLTMHGAEGR
ncbi:hypothetical protein [Streptomyces olivaceus]|uniref:hypothetical protein n=1 Tax=Streptomyces olivaceus TaxID=47716 RepID=UPI0036F0E84D